MCKVRLLLLCVYTFDKSLKLVVADVAQLLVDLQSKQQGKEELVILVQAAAGILEDLISQELDDVGDALGWDGRLL